MSKIAAAALVWLFVLPYLRLRNVLLDFKLWRIARSNRKLQERVARLKAQLAILRAMS